MKVGLPCPGGEPLTEGELVETLECMKRAGREVLRAAESAVVRCRGGGGFGLADPVAQEMRERWAWEALAAATSIALAVDRLRWALAAVRARW